MCWISDLGGYEDRKGWGLLLLNCDMELILAQSSVALLWASMTMSVSGISFYYARKTLRILISAIDMVLEDVTE